MDLEVEQLLGEALRLPPAHRGALAAAIIESLDGDPDPDVERAWDEEADRRLKELEDGTVRAIPWEEVRTRILGDSPPPLD
jgi:putative addiction module component (TIGR02574 family)